MGVLYSSSIGGVLLLKRELKEDVSVTRFVHAALVSQRWDVTARLYLHPGSKPVAYSVSKWLMYYVSPYDYLNFAGNA
jgi:hypothetical protein